MQLLLLVLLNAHGNSATATKLQTVRNIKLQGAVSGNTDFDGSGNVIINTTQTNIAVLTGNVSIPAKIGKIGTTLNYPSGFTKDNCVLISFGSNFSTTKGYAFGYHSNDSSGFLFGTNDRDIILDTTGIQVWYNNSTDEEKTFRYKIVLMKVS